MKLYRDTFNYFKLSNLIYPKCMVLGKAFNQYGQAPNVWYWGKCFINKGKHSTLHKLLSVRGMNPDILSLEQEVV